MDLETLKLLEFMYRQGYFSTKNGIGIRNLANELGISINKARRIINQLRYLGIVTRVKDRIRDKYCKWAIRYSKQNIDLIKSLLKIKDFIIGKSVVSNEISPYEWIDAFIDSYYITGTSAIILRGLSWNYVIPNNALLAIDPLEKNKAIKFLRIYRESVLYQNGFRIGVIFKKVKDCEYTYEEVGDSAIPIASIKQAIVDSLVNFKAIGVDLIEVLSIFIGILLPKIFEEKNYRFISDIIKMAQKQYNDTCLISAFLRNILMRFYLYFEEPEAIELYKLVPKCEYQLSKEMSKKVYEAFRLTILGNKITFYLGLEPNFSINGPDNRFPKDVFAIGGID